jgi:hypothetical protein
MQRRGFPRGRNLGKRLPLVDEVTLGDLDLGDVVVARDEAQPLGVVVDADVRRLAARLDLDFDDAPALGRVDAVASG